MSLKRVNINIPTFLKKKIILDNIKTFTENLILSGDLKGIKSLKRFNIYKNKDLEFAFLNNQPSIADYFVDIGLFVSDEFHGKIGENIDYETFMVYILFYDFENVKKWILTKGLDFYMIAKRYFSKFEMKYIASASIDVFPVMFQDECFRVEDMIIFSDELDSANLEFLLENANKEEKREILTRISRQKRFIVFYQNYKVNLDLKYMARNALTENLNFEEFFFTADHLRAALNSKNVNNALFIFKRLNLPLGYFILNFKNKRTVKTGKTVDFFIVIGSSGKYKKEEVEELRNFFN